MAESASDDSCEAPKDFQISSIDGSESRYSLPHRKCSLCLNFRIVFTCKKCIKSGEIVHSTSLGESLFDKQKRYSNIKTASKEIETACEEMLVDKTKKHKFLSEINRCKENIHLLKLAIQQKKDNMNNNMGKLKELKNFNTEVTTKLPKYKERIEKVCKHVLHKKALLERQRNQIELELESLKNQRKQRLKQVVDYVFPITEIKISHSMGFDGIGCTERAIAEASRPAGGQTLPQLQLLSSLLPLDLQDYNSYCHCVAENKCIKNPSSNDQEDDPVSVKLNAAYRISGMLAYSAQLLQIMAFYLDVRLPYNITYSDMCSSEVEERIYRRLVWKVQTCAVTVCDTAGVRQHFNEPPLHTLLRACPLNINGVTCEDVYQAVSSGGYEWLEREWGIWWGMGGSFGHEDMPIVCTDEEEADAPEHIHWDWETLSEHPRSPLPPPPPIQTQVMPIAQGLVTSAAASLASIWRGWTNK